MEAASCANIFVKAAAFYAAAETTWNLACPKAPAFSDRLVKSLGAERVLSGFDRLSTAICERLVGWWNFTPTLTQIEPADTAASNRYGLHVHPGETRSTRLNGGPVGSGNLATVTRQLLGIWSELVRVDIAIPAEEPLG